MNPPRPPDTADIVKVYSKYANDFIDGVVDDTGNPPSQNDVMVHLASLGLGLVSVSEYARYKPAIAAAVAALLEPSARPK